MIRITFLTRPECGLCDAALFVVRKVQRLHPFEVRVVDISAPGNEKWLDAYSEHIPVILCDGHEVCRHRVNEGEFRRFLRLGADSCPSAPRADH